MSDYSQRKLYISVEALIATILFVLSPFFSSPLIIKGILERKKWSLILGVMFVGFLGILYPPAGDLYRYADDFETVKNLTWEEFKLFLLLRQEVLLPFLSFCFGQIGLLAEHTRFLFTATSYLIYFSIFYSSTKDADTLKERIYCYITLVPLMFNGTVFRFGFATAVFVFGLYLYLIKDKSHGLLFWGLSALIHFTFLPLACLGILCKRFCFNLSYKCFVLLSILLVFADRIPIGAIIIQTVLPGDYLDHYGSYIDGEESAALTTGFSFVQLFAFCFGRMSFILSFLLYASFYKANPQPMKIKWFINCLIITLIACGSIPIFFGRYINVLGVFLALAIVYYRKSFSSPLLFQFFIWSKILSALFALWQFRFFMMYSQFDSLLTSNVYDLLTFEYDQSWINANIDSNGNFIKWLEAGYEPGR